MKVVWANNWFLDYRIPVYELLYNDSSIEFYLIYNSNNIPNRVVRKIKEKLGSNAIDCPYDKKFNIVNSKSDFANKKIQFQYNRKLLGIFNRINPDIVIGEGFFRWGIYSFLFSIFKKKKYIMLYERTAHTERNASLLIKFVRKLMLNFINVVCVNGEQSTEYIRSLSKNIPITNGHMVANVEWLSSKANSFFADTNNVMHKLNDEKTKFLYVGQLNDRKGIVRYTENFISFMEDSYTNFELNIIGDGDLRENLEVMIKDKDYVKLHGQIDHDLIVNYYLESDVFVMPTLEDNWSLVVPEAMACRLPIITSIYNGCHPEFIKDNGWIYDPYQSEELGCILKSIARLSKPQLIDMGMKSSTLISQHTPKSALNAIKKSIKIAND